MVFGYGDAQGKLHAALDMLIVVVPEMTIVLSFPAQAIPFTPPQQQFADPWDS